MTDVRRKMTGGELRYAIEVFGSSLDYVKVFIHNTRAYFFQPSDTAMTPNGEVYFPAPSYKPDFSSSLSDAAWLIHELTHSWQHQQGMWVRTRAALDRNYRYGNLDAIKRPFLTFGIEQQASIVADYFRMKHGLDPIEGQGAIAAYERLIPFVTGTSR